MNELKNSYRILLSYGKAKNLPFSLGGWIIIHHLDLHNSSRHTQPYSISAKIELGLCYNSCQYHLPWYFASILQMQLKDPWILSQLDTSPQLCNPSLHSLMSTKMNKKNEKQNKAKQNNKTRHLANEYHFKQRGCSKFKPIALTNVSRSQNKETRQIWRTLATRQTLGAFAILPPREQGGRSNPYGILAVNHLETVSIGSQWPEPLSPHMKFTQGRTAIRFYFTLRGYFKLEMFAKV